MSRPEVLSIVGGETFDAREIKGVEVTGKETHVAGMSADWQLFLRYDEAERLIAAEARFVNRSCGIFSTDEVSVFP